MSATEFCSPRADDEWRAHSGVSWESENDVTKILRQMWRPVEDEEEASGFTLERRFHEHATRWLTETSYLSSPLQRMVHPSYQAILGMAAESFDNKRGVIRLMLRDLKAGRGDWALALSYLTQENPVHPNSYGNTAKVVKAWLEWGKERRLI